MHRRDHIERFLAAVEETPNFWNSLDVRCLAVRTGESWDNLVTSCWLLGHAPEAAPRLTHLPVTDTIACRQVILSARELPKFLKAVRAGHVDLAGVTVRFLTPAGEAARPPEPYESVGCYLATATAMAQHTMFPVAHLLELTGGRQEELYRQVVESPQELDVLLRTLEHPWDGLEGLAAHGLRTVHRVGYATSASLSVVAPIPAQLARCELHGETLTYSVLAGSQSVAERCSVGFFGLQLGGGVVSETLALPKESWTELAGGNGYECICSCEPDRVLRGTVFLRVGPFVIAKAEVVEPVGIGGNPRVLAYDRFDPNLDFFTQVLLDPAPHQKDDFHRAVARLLTFGGFLVDSFAGEKSLQGSGLVDLLAYAPSERQVLVIECTIGPLASKEGKLSRLVGRTREVATAIGQGPGPSVLPMMVTSRLDVAEYERDDAARDGVAVLTRGHLRALLDMTRAQASMRELLTWCRACIPPREGQGGRGRG